MSVSEPFQVLEATIADIHAAYQQRRLKARELVQLYLDRIAAYDKQGPAINAVISINAQALEDAARLDEAFERSGFTGPLHGIPLVIKDQVDVRGMATTLGSVLFRNFYPERDADVVRRLRQAGAIILAKSTLGELGGGDCHGSLFGSTRNPYDPQRTSGGSSGGSAACIAANFATAAVAQEGFASIRRPAIWNSIVGMRPTAGLVSRTGAYAGWPAINGSLGPMARTVEDLARLLDAMVGYDAADPLTAHGVGHAPASYAAGLSGATLKGARLGILRQPMGYDSEPDSADFAKVEEVFNRAVAELAAAGAEIVDPVEIPELGELLALRRADRTEADEDESFALYLQGCPNPPYASRAEVAASPLFAEVHRPARERWLRTQTVTPDDHYQFLRARERLMTLMLKTMADHKLDCIVHKAVEHQPTLIRDGVNPPYVNQKGAPHINTFLVYVPSIVVPAGFTSDALPAGITFLGRPFDDARMIELAHAYERATQHRRPPASTP